MKKVDLRLATRLSIGQKINEAGRRKINLHDVALALGVSERTIRNWCNQAKKDVPKMGRPSHSQEILEKSKRLVFEEMDKLGSPGWRPISVLLKGKVSVRLVQRYVAEFKFLKRQDKKTKRMEVIGKNVIWTMDGAITKDEQKIENQVIKDRGTKNWVGHQESLKASKASDVVKVLSECFDKNGKPLVLSTDNGAAYTNKLVSKFLEANKVIHLLSLPRTPQHNGSVEVGIKELREIMNYKKRNLKECMNIANARPRKYGRNWLSSHSVYENDVMLYNESDRDLFFNNCVERLRNLKKNATSFREMRMLQRSIVFEELAKRKFVTEWKMTKNG